jgi:hypothetical protein
VIHRRSDDLGDLGVGVEHHLDICLQIEQRDRRLAVLALAANAAIPRKQQKKAELLPDNSHTCISRFLISEQRLVVIVVVVAAAAAAAVVAR